MLLEFSMKNYKCFKEEVKLSLIASNYDKTTRQEDNLFEMPKFGLKLLKSAVIYGANASGKTKLVEGLAFMKSFIFNSSKESQLNETIDVTPFLLNTETETAPTSFEVIFIHNDEMYRYGFEVDQKQICAEWLYHKPKTKEIELFYREKQNFEVHTRRFRVKDLIENKRIRPNALLLSVAASWNDTIAKTILEWLQNFNTLSGINHSDYKLFSAEYFIKNRTKVIQLLKNADLGIENLNIKTIDASDLSDNLPDEIKAFLKEEINKGTAFLSHILTYHRKYNNRNELKGLASFNMQEDESEGTKKYFALSGPILATLEKGGILIIDELANKLHPNLTRKIIETFNSKTLNPRNAQLIFNTHDTHLLSTNLFRRDQIWFTEKDRYGAASLYSLASFKSIRKEDNFEKNYINGKYGAVPYLMQLFQA